MNDKCQLKFDKEFFILLLIVLTAYINYLLYWLLVFSLYRLLQIKQIKSWKKIDAHIIKSSVQRYCQLRFKPIKKIPFYQYYIFYRYLYNNTEYEGDRYALFLRTSWVFDDTKVMKFRRLFNKSHIASIYVNPDNPEESVYRNSVDTISIIIYAATLLLSVFILIYCAMEIFL